MLSRAEQTEMGNAAAMVCCNDGVRCIHYSDDPAVCATRRGKEQPNVVGGLIGS